MDAALGPYRDRSRAVAEPVAKATRDTCVATAAEWLWGVGAMGHPLADLKAGLGSRLAGRARRASASCGAADRRCHEPELGSFCEARRNPVKQGRGCGAMRYS